MANVQYYDVLLRPVVTEKSMEMMSEKKYTFFVHPEANKIQIKEAVEKMFPGTKVRTAKTKKAIVSLTADSKDIEFFDGM